MEPVGQGQNQHDQGRGGDEVDHQGPRVEHHLVLQHEVHRGGRVVDAVGEALWRQVGGKEGDPDDVAQRFDGRCDPARALHRVMGRAGCCRGGVGG